MPQTPLSALRPRKLPRQARAAATVEAILSAAIQVLLTDGPRLTTTRVAERAGVSVGTMYQYFPNKHALLFAVLTRHIDAVAAAMEGACGALRHKPLAEISDGLVRAYLDAKTTHLDASRALYAAAAELDTADLIGRTGARIGAAMKDVLGTASNARILDVDTVVLTLRATLMGTVRSMLERNAAPRLLPVLRRELPAVCRAYLLAASS